MRDRCRVSPQQGHVAVDEDVDRTFGGERAERSGGGHIRAPTGAVRQQQDVGISQKSTPTTTSPGALGSGIAVSDHLTV